MRVAILKTLAYGDIFDFPLKPSEIWQFLIGDPGQKASYSQFNKILSKFPQKEGYFFLPGRRHIVDIRQKRKRSSAKKKVIAGEVAKTLKIIPTIKMVGITGALAWENCEKDDDIDFLIVTSKKTLWLTRFLVTLLTEFLGRRRHPNAQNPTEIKDKICLNMFLDEDYLTVPKKEQDLYTAHEVAKFKLLWDRDLTCQRFLAANPWVGEYLPNAMNSEFRIQNSRKKKDRSLYDLLKPVEFLCRWVQLWYMRKRRTTEVITDGAIRFHPKDIRPRILKEYQRELQKTGKFWGLTNKKILV